MRKMWKASLFLTTWSNQDQETSNSRPTPSRGIRAHRDQDTGSQGTSTTEGGPSTFQNKTQIVYQSSSRPNHKVTLKEPEVGHAWQVIETTSKTETQLSSSMKA